MPIPLFLTGRAEPDMAPTKIRGYGYVRHSKEDALEFGSHLSLTTHQPAYVYYYGEANIFYITRCVINDTALSLIHKFV